MTEQELIETIEEATDVIANEENLSYMVFQYDIDSYYIGTVDIEQIKQNEYAFNLLYPLSIYLENGTYIFTDLNGLGDCQYQMNLNKSKVISIFTPNDRTVAEYERIINKLYNNIPALNGEQTTDLSGFYEVKTIQ